MNYTKIVLSLALIVSAFPQFVAGHGKMSIFPVEKSEVGVSANVKRIANILAPSNDDYVDYFVSDEKVTMHLPKSIAQHGKVEVTKKNIVTAFLIVRAFISQAKHNVNKKNMALGNALIEAGKETAYDVTKDEVIGAILDTTGSQVELPHHVRKHYLFNAACYVAGKAAGFALNIAIDKSYNVGKQFIFGKR